ncbi:MAG TPA: virulence-associated protein E [Maritimibacter sp.]|nr:virulence-associated protein E [Maritimibacter sp.]
MDGRTLTHNLGGAWRHGQGNAPCPICQPERRRDQTALSITEADGKLLLHCFKSGCSFVEIASAAHLPLDRAQVDFEAVRETKRKQAEYRTTQLAKARGLWDAAKPITGTKGEAYLRGRGVSCNMPSSLRWIPDIHHGPSMNWGAAMVAKVQPTGGVHRTFFDKKGNRLAKSAKMMLGPCSGGAVRLSETPSGPLVVCEGIETGLSLLSGLLKPPVSVWAALSAHGVASVELPNEPGALIIATDGDNAGREAGDKLGLRATALGWKVSLMPAPDGKDWNDVLTEGEAA